MTSKILSTRKYNLDSHEEILLLLYIKDLYEFEIKLHKTIILTVILYGCKSLFLTSKEEHGL
jgi:hypothetical protein